MEKENSISKIATQNLLSALFHDINLYTALEFTFISKRVFQSEGDFVRKGRKMTFASKTTFKFFARWSVLQKVESFKRRKVKLIVYAAVGELEEGRKVWGGVGREGDKSNINLANSQQILQAVQE